MRATEKTLVTVLTSAAFLAAPLLASAAANNLSDLLGTLTQIVLLGTPFAAALLYFFWNLAELLFTIGDAEKKKQARARVVYGVIALFVLFTVAGLVGVLQNSIFGTTTTTGGSVPTVQSGNPFGSGSGSVNSGNSASGNQDGGAVPLNPFTPPSEQPTNPVETTPI